MKIDIHLMKQDGLPSKKLVRQAAEIAGPAVADYCAQSSKASVLYLIGGLMGRPEIARYQKAMAKEIERRIQAGVMGLSMMQNMEGELVGFTITSPTDGVVSFVEYIWVNPKYRRLGVANMLLDEVEMRHAKVCGCAIYPMAGILEKRGYRLVGQTPGGLGVFINFEPPKNGQLMLPGGPEKVMAAFEKSLGIQPPKSKSPTGKPVRPRSICNEEVR